ncbi:MAG: hypothetical protein SF182_14245 [Deltaproteobacteria bacterium]|nr:hypothetical protein [Deltaproteobacteria bacterium]
MPRSEIAARALDRMSEHLRMACAWPPAGIERAAAIGDYRFYIVEFSPAPDVEIYLQIWSEPGDPVLFEVSSGYAHGPTAAYLTPRMHDALMGRGFAPGDAQHNFRKRLPVEGRADEQALAREILAILSEVLGYDGRSALRFRLHQGSRTESTHGFTAMQPGDFLRLLHDWGVAADLANGDAPVIHANAAGVLFAAHFERPQPPPFTRFEVVVLASALRGPRPRAGALNRRLRLGRAIQRSAEEVLITLPLLIGGGVTAGNLQRQVQTWIDDLREVSEDRGREPAAPAGSTVH